MRILVVEDAVRLSDVIAEELKRNGYDADVVHDGNSGYEYASSGIYDMVVLDLMLPKMDGYEVLRRLRGNRIEVPVLILSAKSELQDKVDGFREGADDYVTKPFEMAELLLRIRAILRRRQNPGGDRLYFGDLCFDLAAGALSRKGGDRTSCLSGKEHQLLEFLMCNPKIILSKEEITEKVWGFDSSAEYNHVEVYMSFLRKKLKFLGTAVNIRTIRGIGYVMEETHKN